MTVGEQRLMGGVRRMWLGLVGTVLAGILGSATQAQQVPCPEVCPDGSRAYLCVCRAGAAPNAAPTSTAPDPSCSASRAPGAGAPAGCPSGVTPPTAQPTPAATPAPAAPPATAPTAAAAGGVKAPATVAVPPGVFMMGSTDGYKDEKPPHAVKIGYPLEFTRYAITFDEWDACVAGGGCGGHKPEDRGWGRGNRPVINVNYKDAQLYAAWLSERTGQRWRLPTEAEWEYAARGGGISQYPWGDNLGVGNTNCAECGSPWDKRQTAPVGSFKPNAFGLHEMVGNVRQWVIDCATENYAKAPADGSPDASGDCDKRIARGGSWYDKAPQVRVSDRTAEEVDKRMFDIGIRLVRVPN